MAEVIVAAAPGQSGRRGSGYRVGERCVLTAAHVVAGPAPQVRVRFDADLPGEWTADAEVVLCSPSADLALLELGPVHSGTAAGGHAAAPPQQGPARIPFQGSDVRRHANGGGSEDEPGDEGRAAPGAGPVPFPRYAAVPDADLAVHVSAMGFPRFKLRTDRAAGPGGSAGDGGVTQYRDTCHVVGTVSVLSNRRSGTLELAVPPPRADPDPDRSPWEGMSGAAVWCDGALVGVVSAHHRSDGLGRLTAVRIDSWHEALGEQESRLLAHLGGLPGAVTPGRAATGAAAADSVAPRLDGLPADVPLPRLMDLVLALERMQAFDGANLGLLLDSITPEIAAMSPRSPQRRADILSILRTCLRYPGSLDQLIEAVRLLEGDSTDVARMDRAVAQLARFHS